MVGLVTRFHHLPPDFAVLRIGALWPKAQINRLGAKLRGEIRLTAFDLAYHLMRSLNISAASAFLPPIPSARYFRTVPSNARLPLYSVDSSYAITACNTAIFATSACICFYLLLELQYQSYASTSFSLHSHSFNASSALFDNGLPRPVRPNGS